MTCAEDLPEFEHMAENVDNQITDGYDEEVSLSFQKSFVYSCEVSVEERLALQGLESSTPRMRFLPPGQTSDLFYQFLAWTETRWHESKGQKGLAGKI